MRRVRWTSTRRTQIVLDGGAHGMRDHSLLRELLARGACPVVVLGRAHNPLACARALDAGASDWIARPFSTEELLARVRVILRSRRASELPRAEAPIGALSFDAGGRSVRRNGKPVPLSRTELKLLRVLAARPGAVLSREELLNRVWGPAYHDATNFLWVYVRRLRKKIEADPSAPQIILPCPALATGWPITMRSQTPKASAAYLCCDVRPATDSPADSWRWQKNQPVLPASAPFVIVA